MSNKNPVDMDLKEKQVHELLKLQQLFHSHYLTQELVNGMIGLYVKCAEIVHKKQHPLRIFFMEKIKFVLSRPEVIRILEKKSAEQNKNMKEANRVLISQGEELEMKKMTEEAKQDIRQNHFINNKKERNYENTHIAQEMREKERNMKIQMQVKIMAEVEENMEKMKNELNNQAEINKNKANQINKIVQKQDMALNQRLARRKRKLRKKSVDINEIQVIQIQAPEPIAKKQLLEMKKEIHQTYERFTRLTMNKTKRLTQTGGENQGRVKVNIQQAPIDQEDIFDELQKEKKINLEQPKTFSKKKQVQTNENIQQNEILQINFNEQIKVPEIEEIKEIKTEPKVRDSESSVEYKAFDQNKGRVTVRQKNYEEIEDEQLF